MGLVGAEKSSEAIEEKRNERKNRADRRRVTKEDRRNQRGWTEKKRR